MSDVYETVPPRENLYCNDEKLSDETICPDKDSGAINHKKLEIGVKIAGKYTVEKLADRQGGQSEVYIVRDSEKKYVLKKYNNGWVQNDKMKIFLSNVSHPNIAGLVDYDYLEGEYYEIYNFYPEGTLGDEKINDERDKKLKKIIIPSINEGLKCLHDNGIIHRDIKPANLFYNNNKQTVIIGDFGISGFTNRNGDIIGPFVGTPEYAPPVWSFSGETIINKSYDYASLGLVIMYILLGWSFFNNKSKKEIAASWENGLRIPNFEDSYKALINGLLAKENERWGYIEVKRWCEGEFISRKRGSLLNRTEKIKPLYFGEFDGEVLYVNTLHQLADAFKTHWSQGRNKIKNIDTIDFVLQFKKNYNRKKIREIIDDNDTDISIFKLIMFIEPEEREIAFCGKIYSDLNEFVNCLSGYRDAVALKFVKKRMLIYFLKQRGYDIDEVDKLAQFIDRNGCDDVEGIKAICFSFTEKNTIYIKDSSVSSLDDLAYILCDSTVEQIDEIVEEVDFIPWLKVLGFEKEAEQIKSL